MSKEQTATLRWLACFVRRRKPLTKRSSATRTQQTEARRQAHYMRNFLEYDGGQQEEFEE